MTDERDGLDSSSNELLQQFSTELNRELDRIGFAPDPQRAISLMPILGAGRVQTYRIRSGKSFPPLDKLVALRSIGVSFDSIFSALLSQNMPIDNSPQGSLLCSPLGNEIQCSFEFGPDADFLPDMKAINAAPDKWLILGNQNMPLGQEEKPVGAIRFKPYRPTLAIVDDDAETSHMIKNELAPMFDIDTFEAADQFLESVTTERAYQAFLIDWRLPGTDSPHLISEVRKVSQAPIFIMTGFPEAGREIAQVIDGNYVHYMSKPVEMNILAAQLRQAIRQSLESFNHG